MLITYRYRIYPNKEQEELIQKTFGCCRFVYNQCLNYKINNYKNEGKNISKFECMKWSNNFLKTNNEWLREVDKFSLESTIENLDMSYQKFFKEKSGFPKFKSKRNNHRTYKTKFTNNNIEIDFNKSKVKLPKLKWIKCKVHRLFKGRIINATISQLPSGKYFVSILLESSQYEIDKVDNKVGIDLGVKDLVITSNGDKFENIKPTKKYEDKLAKLQRKMAKKKLGSNNRVKQRIKIARLHEKISNTRKDNLHKISHKLINENQVIVSENLKVLNMMKNHNLSKSIQDCSWYELTRQLEYKSDWYGRTYIKVNTYFPSSQLCSNCGHRNTETKNLSIRRWTCSSCGEIHDRDINASINILNEGLRLLNS